MQKRLFIGISVPEDVKKRIFRVVQKEYGDLPVKWTSQSNLHLTLNFLGYTPEEKIPELCEVVRSAVSGAPSFELNFSKFDFGPNKTAKKMVWAVGERSEELENIKYALDRSFCFVLPEKHSFLPHITLGRIRKNLWEKTCPDADIEKNFSFSFPVSSVELLESRFEKGKRVYYIMETFPLN
jgi:2'-5' RNA ligase